MITFIKTIIICIRITMLRCLNPIKIRIIIIFIRSFTFILIRNIIGRRWFPLIFYILFLGGILIIFIVLSSLIPNEKSIKNKLSWTTILILALITTAIHLPLTNNFRRQLKWFIQSTYNLYIIILLILLYFIRFIYLLSQEKITLRSCFCYNKTIL